MVPLPNVSTRPATASDASFVRSVFFETQRWLLEALFGRRSDALEEERFAESYDEAATRIVIVDGVEIGWMSVFRSDHVDLDGIYLSSAWQRRGIGTILIERLIDEARATGLPVRLNTAAINPARALYERLGFRVTGEAGLKVSMEHPGGRLP